MRIVYNSFHGRFSDNPRAIWERLADRPGLDHVWLADPNHMSAFPEDVSTVSVDDPAVRDVLESADLLVANTHTEFEWDKDPRTTYLQTWHGTPLKRIHRDVLWAPEGRLDRLDRDIAKWDLLLSPNTESTPRLAKAFSFDGPIHETGYPRNDALLSPEADRTRAVVRDGLGLRPDQRVVLYAPTWRDQETFAGQGQIELPLAVEELMAGLGDETVLLVRAHNMVTGRLGAWSAPGVLDVSHHRDIRDLYLAADVLLTDYSSAMFDFALTGRPLVFFAHDLATFRETIRGFYFDLDPVAPGPITTTTAEVVAALGQLDVLREEYAGRVAAFRAAYCHLEDGRATDRVLALLGLD